MSEKTSRRDPSASHTVTELTRLVLQFRDLSGEFDQIGKSKISLAKLAGSYVQNLSRLFCYCGVHKLKIS